MEEQKKRKKSAMEYLNITKKRVVKKKSYRAKLDKIKRDKKNNAVADLQVFELSEKQKREKVKILPQAYFDNRCNLSATCRQLGIARNTFANWRRDSKRLDSILTDIEQGLIDDMESVVTTVAIGKEDAEIALKWLDRKARHRGYGKVEQKQMDVNIQIVTSIPRAEAIDVQAVECKDVPALSND